MRFHYSTKTPINEGIKLENPIQKQPWELTSDKITVQTKIGAGAFGEVFEGTLSQGPNKPPLKVAIKMTKVNDQNKAKIDEMYKEARLMRQYKHKNVVTFHGIVIKSAENAMVVMELVPMKTKVGYATDLAVGLVYLHSKGCMHRDVACRNCLLDIKNNIVKITDFGLSKQGESYKIPDNEPLPIRWQAPEVIKTRIYTAKCDVYSYAITVWEIFHNAETPFTGIDNKTIKEKVGAYSQLMNN
ncbi:unnamed protein product [Heligmosomoides polygyrus]|uniref:Protein kinase domain-containing protein n=1 Tax=Heligmosomoides polygyrus TaxID=6339 RepID=A0A3P8CTA5_HELPZ|nr:unnamed protein product [Heligmosomoides polygyrus]